MNPGRALVFALTVTDNAGQSVTDTCIVNVTWVNVPPVAQAGADQTVGEGQIVQLDGSNSVDVDNNIAIYQWQQTKGPAVSLSDANASLPFFTAPDVGPEGASLTFQLTVVDGGGLQDSDTCVVNVSWENQPPVADAGPDQQVLEGDEVVLDGSNSRDPDDGIASYQWTQTDGMPVALSDATAVAPVFSAPNVETQGTTLTFRLTVTDHNGLQHHDTCNVNVLWENLPPVASAGNDQTVNEGAQVTLDGTNSSDPDDGIAAYAWTQTGGPSVALSDPMASQPVFTAPDVDTQGIALTFKLTVTDMGGLKSDATTIVNVSWQNQAPQADAGPDQNAQALQAVALNGAGSFDGDDGIAAYQWKQLSGPPVSLANPNAAETTFTAPQATEGADLVLTFQLTVTDNGGLQDTDACVVTIGASVQEPDTTPPQIQITSPDSQFVLTKRNRINLTGTSWDDQNIDRVIWESSAGYSGEATGTVSWHIDDLRLGRWLNVITVTVYDKAGNSASDQLYVFAGIWR